MLITFIRRDMVIGSRVTGGGLGKPGCYKLSAWHGRCGHSIPNSSVDMRWLEEYTTLPRQIPPNPPLLQIARGTQTGPAVTSTAAETSTTPRTSTKGPSHTSRVCGKSRRRRRYTPSGWWLVHVFNYNIFPQASMWCANYILPAKRNFPRRKTKGLKRNKRNGPHKDDKELDRVNL